MAFKTVDVVIGVALLYLLLTFVASALLEFISAARNWRALMLHDTIRNMLNDSKLLGVNEVYQSPLVLALGRGDAAKSWVDLLEPFGWHLTSGKTPPSYIPATIFSGAVLEGLMNKAAGSFDPSPDGTIDLIRSVLRHPQEAKESDQNGVASQDALRSILETTLATQGASIQAVRFAIEKWFNDTMDRTSGWYKRRTQSCLLLIGIAIAFAFNVDTIGIVRWLWQGDAARLAVVTAATEYVRNNPLPPPVKPSDADKLQDSAPPKDLSVFATRMVKLDKHISGLQYPIGWPPSEPGLAWFLQYLLGALITAIAISMGSTFWFDALQNLLKIRATGPKPAAR
jgi:hypothetical protein